MLKYSYQLADIMYFLQQRGVIHQNLLPENIQVRMLQMRGREGEKGREGGREEGREERREGGREGGKEGEREGERKGGRKGESE